MRAKVLRWGEGGGRSLCMPQQRAALQLSMPQLWREALDLCKALPGHHTAVLRPEPADVRPLGEVLRKGAGGGLGSPVQLGAQSQVQPKLGE